jgi:hypothetical protein
MSKPTQTDPTATAQADTSSALLEYEAAVRAMRDAGFSHEDIIKLATSACVRHTLDEWVREVLPGVEEAPQ